MKSSVKVVSLDRRFEKFEKEVKKRAEEILKILKKDGREVEINLAGGGVLKKLNKIYRGKNKAADILSFEAVKGFPRPELGGKRRPLGEIYLNWGMFSVRGGRKPDWSRVKFLLVHGFLHLFGYNHRSERAAVKMEKKEKQILRKMA